MHALKSSLKSTQSGCIFALQNKRDNFGWQSLGQHEKKKKKELIFHTLTIYTFLLLNAWYIIWIWIYICIIYPVVIIYTLSVYIKLTQKNNQV